MSQFNSACPKSTQDLDEILSSPDDRVLECLEKLSGDCLVLGAAGKMGYHLTRMIQAGFQKLDRQERVIAVPRFSDQRMKERFESQSVSVIQADLHDAASLEALPDVPNLFFLAGVKFGTNSRPELLQQMNQEMPRLVARRYAASRIVAMSTGCVYSFSTPASGGSTETSEMKPPGEYALSCISREEAFKKQSEIAGTPTAIVRLNYSIDLRYGVLVDIARAVLLGEPIDLSTGFVNVIWQRDAISQIIQCMSQASSPAWLVNITGSEALSVRELALGFAERMGREPKFRGSESTHCWLSNSELARSTFGEPSMKLDTMMDWTVDWLLRGMPLLGKPTHFQVRDGNY
ncbi:MAG: NAD(P)-dependent oxidoreductase [Planctomycetota bacterium]|nr:NAD(P)-dependent oxidoreductase [Planctomycetota bacterium]